jgi:glycosyltransferase involved in cell wall biosynthesis
MITYNQEGYIAQAIESVLAQSVNFDYEIIIGEDCSTDRTRAVVLEFRRRYPDRIKLLLRNRNIGGLPNLESTLAACQGEYLAILEGDDYWTSVDKLQKQVDFLDSHPECALCCHRVQCLNATLPAEASAESSVFPPLAAGPYTIEDLLKWNFVMTCSVVLRRHLSGPLPACFSGMKVGDWARFVLAARHGKIELMDEIMATYRLHPGSVWSSTSQLARYKESSEMLQSLDKHLNLAYTNTIRQTLAGFYLQMASIVRQEGKRTETARHVISCLRNGGWQPGSRRFLAGLAAYALIGSWYKVLSRANAANN